MIPSHFTTEIGRMRTQELIARAEHYRKLQPKRPEVEAPVRTRRHISFRKLATVLGLALVLALLVITPALAGIDGIGNGQLQPEGGGQAQSDVSRGSAAETARLEALADFYQGKVEPAFVTNSRDNTATESSPSGSEVPGGWALVAATAVIAAGGAFLFAGRLRHASA
jgi:hypothetical protein